jgi:P4 family phage/plasmid primase-like protien
VSDPPHDGRAELRAKVLSHEHDEAATISSLEEVVARLGGARKNPDGSYMARCPCHDDHTPSLHVWTDKDGHVAWFCHAGCDHAEVGQALGIERRNGHGNPKWTPCGPAIDEYRYTDARGRHQYTVCRTADKQFPVWVPDPTSKTGRRWKLGDTPRVLYRLPALIAAVTAHEPVFLVEGEKDVKALVRAGCVATCNMGGAGSATNNYNWRSEYSEWLRGANVIIVADKDKPGRDHAAGVAASLRGVAAQVCIVEAREDKDAADHLAAGYGPDEFVRVDVPEMAAETSATTASQTSLVEPANPEGPLDGSDRSNGKRFAVVCRDRAKYHPGRGWMVYDPDRGLWEPDTLRAEHLAKEALPHEILTEAAAAPSDERRRELMSGCRRVCSRPGLVAALEMAKSEPDLAADADEFDADPDLVNAVDCVIDTRTGERLRHDSKYMITRQLGAPYEPDAAATLWRAHLERVTDGRPGLEAFLAALFGYGLTGHTFEQRMAIAYGIGANGKSVTIETMRNTMGSYAMAASATTFMMRRSDGGSSDIARLAGARLVTAGETGPAQRLDEALVKQVTGSEPLTARFLFREFFEFVPQFKLMLSTNHKPTIVGTDHGIWRRMWLVPFDVVIPDAEQDHELAAKLRAELPGILAWMVQGCLCWREEGLTVPDEVRNATDGYQLEMDPLAGFLAEQTVDDPAGSVTAGALYGAYRAWAEKIGDDPLTQRTFSTRLSERGLKTSKREPGTGRALYRGLRLSHASQGSQL